MAVYAEVLVDLAARQVDRVFHYRVPPSLAGRVLVGSRVLVPFGRRRIEGYVVGFGHPPEDGIKLKEVLDLLDPGPLFTPHQLELARWMAAYYLCPTVKALQAMIWPLLRTAGPRKMRGLWPVPCPDRIPDVKRAPKSAAVWQVALARPGLTRGELALAAGVSPAVVDTLVARGLLRGEERVVQRDPCAGLPEIQHRPPVLNHHQRRAVQEITGSLGLGERRLFLLHGVTGSGKTEVYLQCIAGALQQGLQAMMLLPEIALTPQMIDIFRGRFGRRVAVLHSRLSQGERYDEYQRLRAGEARVVLGARSAVFAPLEKPGLIILDEEHEPSYKQEETPRYHARGVALRLAGLAGAVVVLGSATPSLESYARATAAGAPYRLVELPERIGGRPLPRVKTIDMRQEIRAGNKSLFSRQLREAMTERLSRGEQIILFLNRRGFSTLVVCRECGLVLKCPHCDISLTFHASGRMRCHYCHYSVLAPSLCPGCGGRYLAYLGAGTQKIEQEIRELFPDAGVMRLDGDTTARRGAHREIIEGFRRGGAGILIGTQMVAKGLDLPGVTLVGVISADLSLFMPDFRASERTFQLLTQVAGRSGRGDREGEVLVQTYSPHHYAVTCAVNHDYQGFYRQEMTLRRSLGYPPFTHLCRILVSGRKEEEVQEAAAAIAGLIQGVDMLGPAPAPLTRIKDRYRWHLVLKAHAPAVLRAAVTPALDFLNRHSRWRKLVVSVDMDPQSMM
ncbi:MAG: primosomal protein N' [Thermoanaerobacteraceae bacterium]|nr:primosomal protein N' [Thermoanaerobacteraceae bacterium]